MQDENEYQDGDQIEDQAKMKSNQYYYNWPDY